VRESERGREGERKKKKKKKRERHTEKVFSKRNTGPASKPEKIASAVFKLPNRKQNYNFIKFNPSSLII
jgi:hypothetical protein